jgi:hypothetical protein
MGMKYDWLLTADLLATRPSELEMYFAELKEGRVTGRDCLLTWSPDGRMLFDGEDIETEDFMAFTGLADSVAEGQDIGTFWVQIEGEN